MTPVHHQPGFHDDDNEPVTKAECREMHGGNASGIHLLGVVLAILGAVTVGLLGLIAVLLVQAQGSANSAVAEAHKASSEAIAEAKGVATTATKEAADVREKVASIAAKQVDVIGTLGEIKFHLDKLDTKIERNQELLMNNRPARYEPAK